jgi:hypothetical protein
MVAAGTPLRTLQWWTGHRDYKTTEIYADFAPDPTQGACGRSAHSAANRGTQRPGLSDVNLSHSKDRCSRRSLLGRAEQ